ncbi:MAG: sigma-54-dependent Fis family transcriptional regulator [Desulfobacteraceae bacterium 4572_123]|nr:MAG: sigma-54-dependent Fis family transcriptional regulator [Desulfobacteraceae bacterium 4572_123]
MLPSIIGTSPNIIKIRELINHVADTGLNIVISGESGVGKEVVAQSLYQKSPRMGKPYIKINCAALPEGLLESELFGYEKGAFTGADQKKKGKFELADDGVLLLDEIGDMPMALQAKLLHVLQSGEFSPLGSEKDFKTDTWIIAATNHDLEQDVKDKNFREDLYYRLNIIKIYISPLRTRVEDIPLLLDYYINVYTPKFNSKYILKPRQIEKLKKYHWPGNVRELQNVLKRILVLGNCDEVIDELKYDGETIYDSDPEKSTDNPSLLTQDLLALELDNPQKVESFSLKKIKKNALDKIEKEVISSILDKTAWNRSKATKILKISYKTLLSKIKELEIEHPSSRNHEPVDKRN